MEKPYNENAHLFNEEITMNKAQEKDDVDIRAQVSSAIEKAEKNVVVPRATRLNSLLSAVAALEVGACVSKAVATDPSQPVGIFATWAANERDLLRNKVATSVTAAALATGHEYTIEVATMMTTRNNIYHVAIVSRTA